MIYPLSSPHKYFKPSKVNQQMTFFARNPTQRICGKVLSCYMRDNAVRSKHTSRTRTLAPVRRSIRVWLSRDLNAMCVATQQRHWCWRFRWGHPGRPLQWWTYQFCLAETFLQSSAKIKLNYRCHYLQLTYSEIEGKRKCSVVRFSASLMTSMEYKIFPVWHDSNQIHKIC